MMRTAVMVCADRDVIAARALDLLIDAEFGAKSTGLPDQEIVERAAFKIASAGRPSSMRCE